MYASFITCFFINPNKVYGRFNFYVKKWQSFNVAQLISRINLNTWDRDRYQPVRGKSHFILCVVFRGFVNSILDYADWVFITEKAFSWSSLRTENWINLCFTWRKLYIFSSTNRHLWHIEDNEFITNYQVGCDKIRVLLFTRTIREYLSEFEGILSFALRNFEFLNLWLTATSRGSPKAFQDRKKIGTQLHVLF